MLINVIEIMLPYHYTQFAQTQDLLCSPKLEECKSSLLIEKHSSEKKILYKLGVFFTPSCSLYEQYLNCLEIWNKLE